MAWIAALAGPGTGASPANQRRTDLPSTPSLRASSIWEIPNFRSKALSCLGLIALGVAMSRKIAFINIPSNLGRCALNTSPLLLVDGWTQRPILGR